MSKTSPNDTWIKMKSEKQIDKDSYTSHNFIKNHHFDLTFRKCKVRHGLRSRSGKPLLIFEGRNHTSSDYTQGEFWTKIAEPYPEEMCQEIARAVVQYLRITHACDSVAS